MAVEDEQQTRNAAVRRARASPSRTQTTVNGVTSAEWEAVRVTENYQSHSPVTDVTSASMTCYQRDVGTGAAKILAAKAGGSVSFTVDPNIFHPGPLHFYMAKVPSGQTAATFDGKGAVWFKIYQDGLSGLGTSSITWPADGMSRLLPTYPP